MSARQADPTFSRLRQIINEPEDRVCIGRIPSKLEEVRGNATRFIDRLHIRKNADADTPDRWFDCELPLNPDMVAIIGNKGSGRSALADVLALRKVIFSHIGEADRLGRQTLDELIEYKTEELKGQIGNARREIERVNGELVRLEDKAAPAHAARIEVLLRQKQQELKARNEIELPKVEQPGEVSPEQKAANDAIAAKLTTERATINRIDGQTAEKSAEEEDADREDSACSEGRGQDRQF